MKNRQGSQSEETNIWFLTTKWLHDTTAFNEILDLFREYFTCHEK